MVVDTIPPKSNDKEAECLCRGLVAAAAVRDCWCDVFRVLVGAVVFLPTVTLEQTTRIILFICTVKVVMSLIV